MKYIIALTSALVLAICLSGCATDNSKWTGKNCTSKGQITICDITKPDGTACQVTREERDMTSDTVDSDCYKKSSKLDCNSGDDNTSGNVCTMGDCIAVLPDGGKDPKYKPDYVKCDDKANPSQAK
jgi:hypothetical protein